MIKQKTIWILGATGRIGSSVAVLLSKKGYALVLVGRDKIVLEKLAAKFGLHHKLLVANSHHEIAQRLKDQKDPIVVCNFIGPFLKEAQSIIDALNPNSDYLDLSNDAASMERTLALSFSARQKNQCLVPGAGFGVYAVEALILSMANKSEPPIHVRVDSIPYIESPGPMGMVVAATIVDAIPAGGALFIDGKIKKVQFGSRPEKLLLPDGTSSSTGAVAAGDLIVAQRASKASNVIAASNMAPASLIIRIILSLTAPLFGVPAIREFLKKQFAKMPGSSSNQGRKNSWIHARMLWKNGEEIEKWLRLGEGMQFTADSAAAVASHLADYNGRAGAFSPGELFGPELAFKLGAELI